MTERNGVSPTELAPLRIAEDRAAKILERAAVLDAKRNSEIEIEQLREAAADAGISAEAFEEALREQMAQLQGRGTDKRGRRKDELGGKSALAAADVAHYAALLRDVLGDDGQVTVGENIDWRDDQGVRVSINPTSSGVTAAVTAEGRLRTRLKGVILPALIPAAVFFLIAFEEEEALIGFFAVLMVIVVSVLGTVFTHRREQKALRKETERIRRMLQHLLPRSGD